MSIKPNNEHIQDLLQKAEEYYQIGNLEMSSNYYKKVLKTSPENIETIINLTHNLNELGKSSETVKIIEKIYTKYHNQDDMLTVNYSFGLIEKGEIKEAKQILLKETKNSSLNYLIYNNLGWCEYLLKNYQNAINAYDKSIELEKNNPLAFSNRGVLRYFIFNEDDGINDLIIAENLGDTDAKEAINSIKKLNNDRQHQ